jgi:hypothetical protein
MNGDDKTEKKELSILLWIHECYRLRGIGLEILESSKATSCLLAGATSMEPRENLYGGVEVKSTATIPSPRTFHFSSPAPATRQSPRLPESPGRLTHMLNEPESVRS